MFVGHKGKWREILGCGMSILSYRGEASATCASNRKLSTRGSWTPAGQRFQENLGIKICQCSKPVDWYRLAYVENRTFSGALLLLWSQSRTSVLPFHPPRKPSHTQLRIDDLSLSFHCLSLTSQISPAITIQFCCP